MLPVSIQRVFSAQRVQIPSKYLRLAIWVVGIAGILITATTVVLVQNFTREEVQKQFEAVVNASFNRLGSVITEADPYLLSLQAYSAVNQRLNPAVFKAVAKQAIAVHPSIQAIEWVPVISHDELAAFERHAQSFYPGFSVRDLSAEGSEEPSRVAHQTYFPVLQVVPLQGNEAAMGFNLGSNPERLQAIHEAIARRSLTLSPRVSLVQDDAKGNGILLFHPAYDDAGALKGFVLAVFKLSTLFGPIELTTAQQGVRFSITDVTDPGKPVALFGASFIDSQKLPPNSGEQSTALNKSGEQSLFTTTRHLNIGGRQFLVGYQGLPDYFATKITALSWLAIAFGVLSTLTLCLILGRLFTHNKRLEDRKKRLQTEFDESVMGPGMWEWDIRNDQLSLSPEACRLFGVADADPEGGLAFYLSHIPEEDKKIVEVQIRDALISGHAFRMSHRVLLPGGAAPRYVESDCFVEMDRKGQAKLLTGVMVDVSESRLSQNKLAESEQTMDWVLSATGEGIWDWHIPSGAVQHNENWYQKLGYAAGELPSTVDSFQTIVHPEDLTLVMLRVKTAMASQHDYYSEHRLRCKDGSVLWVIDRGRVVERDADGNPIRMVGAFIDVSNQKRNEETISKLAFYDPLTGLANRRLLENEVRKTLAKHARSGRSGLLIFIDLDDFKTLNDTQGHDVGDLLLQAFAVLLSQLVRGSDTVARLGGDEFVILIDDAGGTEVEVTDSAMRIAGKILTGLSAPFDLNGYLYKTNASIGLAQFGRSGDTLVDVFKRADLAMYQAKQAGKGTYRFFDPESQRLLDQQAVVEAELTEALSAHQIVPLYQPIASHTGQIVGAETLCRWEHPIRGRINPVDFIPFAEKSDLIVLIDEAMLEHVCRQLGAWQLDPVHEHLTLSVNLSAKYFGFSDFVDRVLGVCHQYNVRLNRLKIELTESMLLKNIGEASRKVKALNDAGIRLSLDDFGTGYSSLSYLQQLRISELKIDQSFVAHIFDDDRSAAICKSILALAHSLSLSVIAEGVETEAQRAFLVEHGCELLQGYLIGRPCEAAVLIPGGIRVT